MDKFFKKRPAVDIKDQSNKRPCHEISSHAEDEPILRSDPLVLVGWNCNGLTPRLRSESDVQAFRDFLVKYTPDVIFLSEVRISAAFKSASGKANSQAERLRSKMRQEDRKSCADASLVHSLMSTPELQSYKLHLSLADTKYSGTAMLWNKNTISGPKVVRYHLGREKSKRHHPEGRVIYAKFEHFSVLHTYSPNNGWEEKHFARRRAWDKQVKEFMERKRKSGIRVIWMGDLNVAPKNEDLSHASYCRQQSKGDRSKLSPADVGLPGCTDAERDRFAEILEADSSVSAMILQEAGWRVKPVLMRCWDSEEDEGSTNCFDRELRAAELTVEKLGLEPLHVYDFVKEYWTDVFENVFLRGIRHGFVPNADLACNRWVKFGAFPERVAQVGGENAPIATGHYAMVQHTEKGTRLLAARDEVKDQSYFLGSVHESALRRVILPVGDLLKTEVVSIAADLRLAAAEAKSSRGICFVGKRSMSEFIEQYVELNEGGKFVDIDSCEVLGDVRNGWALTVGQRARIGGLAEARFVVGRRGRDIVVAPHEHEALRSRGVWCNKADWIGKEPQSITNGGEQEVCFKACSTMRMGRAWVKRENGGWSVRFDRERRKVGRGQAVVVYNGRECLGALWPVCEHGEEAGAQGLAQGMAEGCVVDGVGS
ncbi:unnamed protein product [Agarophyton chilense]